MFENLRAFGVIACVASTVLYMAGGLTDHWVDSDNGNWGLWEMCDDPIHSNNTTAIFNLSAATTGFPFPTTTKDDDDDDEEEEDDDCSHFPISSVPAFLHIVRVIMILAGIILAWGLLSGRSLAWQVPRGDTFVESHKAELMGIVACLCAYVGLVLFTNNYKSVKEEIFTNSYLSWSYYLIRVALFLYFPTAIFMMAPSIHEKYKHGNCHGFCPSCPRHPSCGRCERLFGWLCIRIGLKKPQERRRSVVHARSTTINGRSGGAASEIGATTDIDGGPHDLSFEMSEADSDIFTVTVRSGDEENRQPSGPPLSDLPQYEDVATSGEPTQPPPPSYDDVITGGFLAFSSSTPPPPPPPPFSPDGNRDSSRTLSPPPAYDSIA